MRIIEVIQQSEEHIQQPTRNITNIFNISKLKNELARYHIDIELDPPRYLNKDLRMMLVKCKYIGNSNNLMRSPSPAVVALIVNYDDETAFAMPRSGADKQTMLLISSIANKCICDPFKYDNSIRYKISHTSESASKVVEEESNMISRLTESKDIDDATIDKIQDCKEESIRLINDAYMKFTEILNYVDDPRVEEIADALSDVKSSIRFYNTI